MDCPDSVFVEDTVVRYGDLAVITRPGADERKPEISGTEQTLRDLGYRIARIEAPGTLDGGDVLKYDGTVWVGLGGRTNQAGVDQLAGHLEPFGAHVVGLRLTKVLHLKSAVTALPDGTVVGFEELVDDPTVWSRFLAVPEEAGAHVVLLDETTVLMSTSAPRTRGLYEARGLRVVAVDLTEFEKLEAASSACPCGSAAEGSWSGEPSWCCDEPVRPAAPSSASGTPIPGLRASLSCITG